MKIGDKVRVIELVLEDKELTDIAIGDEGIIDDDTSYEKLPYVKFNKEVHYLDDADVNDNGAYPMWNYQLEVIEENGGNK